MFDNVKVDFWKESRLNRPSSLFRDFRRKGTASYTVMRVSVIIPTLNAEGQIERLLSSLDGQRVRPEEILVVDSSSEDRTRELAERAGARVLCIDRKAFDHGGTRDMALRQTSGELVVFMTQDALPADEHLIENLIRPFSDDAVAAVGGRQIAYMDARPFEKAVRAHNYPADDRVWGADEIESLGVRAFLISDVCAAYRRDAYLAVGGFDHPILTNEDMLMAERLLHAGYRLAYSGGAAVYHSHRFTLLQEYRRNYVIGMTLKRYEERFERSGEMGTGVKLAKNVLLELIRDGHLLECFCFAANCAARLLGNRMGRYAQTRAAARSGDMT